MNKMDMFSLGVFVGIFATLILSSMIIGNTPQAIDVYKSETILEITYWIFSLWIVWWYLK